MSCARFSSTVTRTVRVYDPNRDPPEWNRLLRGTEVAVFTEEAVTGVPIGDQEGPTCEVFDNIRTAELYCKELVAANAKVRCMVFDSNGRGGDPIALYESPNVRSGEITGSFRRWSSAAMITAAVVLIWIDWRSDFEKMWPSVLAWKFVTTALVFITWESVLVVQKILARRRN